MATVTVILTYFHLSDKCYLIWALVACEKRHLELLLASLKKMRWYSQTFIHIRFHTHNVTSVNETRVCIGSSLHTPQIEFVLNIQSVGRSVGWHQQASDRETLTCIKHRRDWKECFGKPEKWIQLRINLNIFVIFSI